MIIIILDREVAMQKQVLTGTEYRLDPHWFIQTCERNSMTVATYCGLLFGKYYRFPISQKMKSDLILRGHSFHKD